MRVTELIQYLNEYKEVYGNIEVKFVAYDFHGLDPDFQASFTRIVNNDDSKEPELFLEVI